MIYMLAGGDDDSLPPLHICILDSQGLEKLREGKPARSPDGTVLIAWTPDIAWLSDRLATLIRSSPAEGLTVAHLIDESLKRPEKPADYSRPGGAEHVKVKSPDEPRKDE